MRASFRVGHLFGIPFHLHWTLLLVAIWIFYDGYTQGQGFHWERIGWVSAVIVLLFGFVLLHELGHALTARAFGKATEKILLFPLGGGAYIREQPDRLLHELLVYAGGPFANLGLAILVLPLLFILSPDAPLLLQYYLYPQSNIVVTSYWWEDLLCFTIGVNVVLALLNLLPAYPLDGGRILQAVLKKRFGSRPASVVVSILGLVAGVGFLVLAYGWYDPLMGLGGLFVGGLSIAELNNGWQRRRLQRYEVAALLRPLLIERLYLQDSAAYAQQLLERSNWQTLPVYDEWNEVKGFLTAERFEEQLAPLHQVRVAEVYDRAYSTCLIADNLLDATIQIVEQDSFGAVVYDRYRPVGFLLMDDVMQLLKKRFERT